MWVLTHVIGMEHSVSQCDTWCATGKSIRPCCAVGFEVGWRWGQGWGGVGSGRVVLIDNGRVYPSKAADALVQVKTTKFGTNVGLNMLLNISSRYSGGLFWSRHLRGLPSSDGYFSDKTPPRHVAICPTLLFYSGGDSVAICHDGALHTRGVGHMTQTGALSRMDLFP